MPSPIASFEMGTSGPMRTQHEPIRRAMEELPVCACRILVQEGRLAEGLSESERKEARRLKRRKESLVRQWAAKRQGSTHVR